MTDNQKNMFKNQQQNIMKGIIKQIRMHYFNFLSSLKFENIAEKKKEKDYAHIELKEEDYDLQAPIQALQLAEIMNSNLNFQDEMVVQNKGYASLIQLLEEIKRLKEFNSNLNIYLMQKTPFVKSAKSSN